MSSSSQFKINIQGSLVKFSLQVSSEDKIFKVKEKVSALIPDSTPSSLKLIFSGRILKDEQIVEECGIKENQTVHLVKSATSKPPPASTEAGKPANPVESSRIETGESVGIQQPQIPGFPQFGQATDGLNSQQIDAMTSNLLEQMVSNPQLMQQVMSMYPGTLSPDAMQMLQNPQYMRMIAQMMRSGIFNQGNGLGQSDESTILQSMQSASNTHQIPTNEPQEPPQVRFANQLVQLNEMGFFDQEDNLKALVLTNGSVSQAIEYLLSRPPQ